MAQSKKKEVQQEEKAVKGKGKAARQSRANVASTDAGVEYAQKTDKCSVSRAHRIMFGGKGDLMRRMRKLMGQPSAPRAIYSGLLPKPAGYTGI